ncbi:hypothetical protein Pcinc_018674 [Petrolisthes cinctipes]|uniref:Uncharacterized protein n=1 Tax=Petrolisthes cinctipes TaxID=88211 RepID=A0AAE1KIR5_PETCI|nr:hypothetical protein Pcinc_018674 [Petrolisthes cinctipes]
MWGRAWQGGAVRRVGRRGAGGCSGRWDLLEQTPCLQRDEGRHERSNTTYTLTTYYALQKQQRRYGGQERGRRHIRTHGHTEREVAGHSSNNAVDHAHLAMEWDYEETVRGLREPLV